MKEKENFLDKNTLIAVALVFCAWLSWDAYMRKKYPAKNQRESPQVQTKNLGEKERKQAFLKSKKSSLKRSPFDLSLKKEKVFSFESKDLSFDISSRGMGFKKLVLNRILDRKGRPVQLFSGEDFLSFETRIKGREEQALHFDMERSSDRSFHGRAFLNGAELNKSILIDPDLFLIKTQVKVSGDLSQISGLSLLLTGTKKDLQKKGMFSFLTQPDFLSFFISSRSGFERIPLQSKEKEDILDIESGPSFFHIQALALGSRYFGQAFMEDSSDVSPEFRVIFKENRYIGLISHLVLNRQKNFEISYKVFAGPKDLLLLKKEHPPLTHWVDFGWFGSLSRLILRILRFFYSLAGNWGLSIILLTLLVRFLLLPFLISAHRSMELTKKLQPEMEKIRVKFKKDPQRKNQEIMALMKSHKANPLGGCLPLLLQIPVFWALWKALAGSYSLYRAPFAFWIQDLSWKDPFYVLPVLMGVFMFVQQKITPVSMNKEMMRVMQFMPVLMALFMLNLPSGLVLYMLVSTAFGMVQQFYMNKKGKANV